MPVIIVMFLYILLLIEIVQIMKDLDLSNTDLRGKYNKTFQEVVRYCNILLENIDGNTKEEILLDTLDVFKSAQDEKIPVQNIIGNSVEEYVEEICKNLPFKYRIKYLLDLFMYWAVLILVFNGIEFITNFDNDILSITSNLGTFLTSIGICFTVSRIFKLLINIIYIFNRTF